MIKLTVLCTSWKARLQEQNLLILNSPVFTSDLLNCDKWSLNSCFPTSTWSELNFLYHLNLQVKCKPKVGYMKKQPDITNNMRAILVDWLVEVGEEYKLQNETLHLAVNYIDRFLSSMSVLRGKLQLVGTAAMLLAS